MFSVLPIHTVGGYGTWGPSKVVGLGLGATFAPVIEAAPADNGFNSFPTPSKTKK